ncbi:MAG: haloacid dehalogenase type II [Bacteroidota bacterium]
MTAYDGFLFDAYGTLFRLELPNEQLDALTDGRANVLMDIWRSRQLQYTWLRSLMQRHVDFEQITLEALHFAMDFLQIRNEAVPQLLMPIYLRANCFDEVPKVLDSLKQLGKKTAILSNGTPRMLQAGVANAGLQDKIDHLFSVEQVGIFKPDPRVYQMAIDQLQVEPARILFVSSNAWDVAGASSAGLSVAWVNRNGHPPERLPANVTYEARDLKDLLEKMKLGHP